VVAGVPLAGRVRIEGTIEPPARGIAAGFVELAAINPRTGEARLWGPALVVGERRFMYGVDLDAATSLVAFRTHSPVEMERAPWHALALALREASAPVPVEVLTPYDPFERA
jgi:hypothetical protein